MSLTCGKCDEGWICEAHPDRPWPHDDCAGPGIPCDVPTCPYCMRATGTDAMGTGVRIVPAACGRPALAAHPAARVSRVRAPVVGDGQHAGVIRPSHSGPAFYVIGRVGKGRALRRRTPRARYS